MVLFRAIHATKVLALAGLVIATSCIPMQAQDWGGPPEVQTRTRHIRMYPRHDFDRRDNRNHRGGSQISQRDWADKGPPEVDTRTRHVRLPRYRPHTGRWKHRDGGWVRDRVGREIWISGRRTDDRRGFYGGDDFPDYIPGIGTYAGGISAFRVPGNGIYFNRDRNDRYRYVDDAEFAPQPRRKGPKIITVSPKTMNRACAYEHGVCVIRR